MKPKQIIIGLVIGVMAVIFVYNFWGEQAPAPSQYTEQIKQARLDKEHYLRTSEKSPIKNRSQFKGLIYYPPQEKYKVNAQLEKLAKQEFIEVKTSKDETETYQKFAWAKFVLNGGNHRLLVLKKPRMPQLFIAFTDETSGKQTYGGGRYLDFPYKAGVNSLTIDFNLAYNPYCVYNYDYSCPLPPQENHLSVAIEAGEKTEN
ncbi:MAG: DUF1684 domain-containing protein [Microscillaceae bacterium]|jgi:hypothetical protein|nr:DUF1684 domain-containing protein [Microscillaceae bacterium]